MRSSRSILMGMAVLASFGMLGSSSMPAVSSPTPKRRKFDGNEGSNGDDPSPRKAAVGSETERYDQYPTAGRAPVYSKPPTNGAREVARRQKQMARAAAKAARIHP